MLFRPAAACRSKSGSTGCNCSISTFWRRIWRASVSALRVRAAISESSGLRDENRSDRSPDDASTRVEAVSAANERLVARMRSVR